MISKEVFLKVTDCLGCQARYIGKIYRDIWSEGSVSLGAKYLLEQILMDAEVASDSDLVPLMKDAGNLYQNRLSEQFPGYLWRDIVSSLQLLVGNFDNYCEAQDLFVSFEFFELLELLHLPMFSGRIFPNYTELGRVEIIDANANNYVKLDEVPSWSRGSTPWITSLTALAGTIQFTFTFKDFWGNESNIIFSWGPVPLGSIAQITLNRYVALKFVKNSGGLAGEKVLVYIPRERARPCSC
jgi:hypothetical protein